MHKRFAALPAALIAVVMAPAAASAHPLEAGELHVPWTDKLSESGWLLAGPPPNAGPTAGKPAGTGSGGLQLVGNADKDGTTNSDLAFWGHLAYAGNYSGFRILDIRGEQPRTVVDFACNGPQNDVSVHEMGGKRFLFQSVDTAQTVEDCTSVNAEIVNGGRVGYEGVRVFDVTDPAKPRFIDMVQTACGSHTHSIIPDGDQAYIYVSSYPLASNITPPGSTPPNADYRACTTPHKKISIIKVSAPGGQFRFELKEQPLSDDTAFNRGFQACHDIQFFMPRKTAVASCAGDGAAVGHQRPVEPDVQRRGQAHAHLQPVGRRQLRVHPLGRRQLGRQDVRDHGRDGRRRGAALLRRGLDERLLLLLRHGRPGRRRARAARPLHDPAQPGLGDLRVAQRDRDPDQGPQAHERGLLPGRRLDRRLHRPRERP